MLNEDTFVEELKKSTPIREQIANIHAPTLRTLRSLFTNAFSMEGKEFTLLKDMLYYKGGWPTEETPPRMETLFSKVAVIAKYCTFLEIEDEFDIYCKQFGIVVTPMGDPTDYLEVSGFEDTSKFNTQWNEIFAGDPPITKKEILEKLLECGLKTQKEICELADKIKLEHGTKVELSCKMAKGTFSKAVNLKLRKDQGRDIDDQVQNALEQHIIAEEALNIVNE
jgi:hypothetical protein